jgi:ketosteroid isomerase-like protein
MNAQVKTDISRLIEQWQQAVMAKDIERIVSFYADDIVSFDAVGALKFKGKAAYRVHWEACMKVCPGPGIFEFLELHIVPAAESAFAFWLARCGGAGPDGVVKACWMRVTAGYQRINGQWQVVHEHWSAPFDMLTGTTLFELEP